MRGKPTVATAHGTTGSLLKFTGDFLPFQSKIYASLVTQTLERIGFRSAGSVAAVSNFCMKVLVEDYGLSPEKVMVIYNGIDPRKAHRVKTNLRSEFGLDYLLLSIGRLAKQKGIEFLLRAMPMLKNYNAKLVVAGAGPEGKNLDRLALQLGIKERVIFTGGIDDGRKFELYPLLTYSSAPLSGRDYQLLCWKQWHAVYP